MQRLAVASLAEVEREGVTPEEPHKTVQLADAVLKRCSGKAPTIPGMQLEGCFSGVRRALLDVVRFVKLRE